MRFADLVENPASGAAAGDQPAPAQKIQILRNRPLPSGDALHNLRYGGLAAQVQKFNDAEPLDVSQQFQHFAHLCNIIYRQSFHMLLPEPGYPGSGVSFSDKESPAVLLCKLDEAGDSRNFIDFDEFFTGNAHNVHRHFACNEFHAQRLRLFQQVGKRRDVLLRHDMFHHCGSEPAHIHL